MVPTNDDVFPAVITATPCGRFICDNLSRLKARAPQHGCHLLGAVSSDDHWQTRIASSSMTSGRNLAGYSLLAFLRTPPGFFFLNAFAQHPLELCERVEQH